MNTEVTVEVEATALGWVPEDDFKGDKSRWVDAETFVKRGHEIMPILRKNNTELIGKLTQAETKLAATNAALEEQKTSLKAILEFQASEVKRQVAEKMATLKEARKLARKEEDQDRVDELDEAIDELKEKSVAAPAPPPPAPSPPAVEPWAVAFEAANRDWLGVDKKRTAIFAANCDEIYSKEGLRGTALLEKAKAETDAFFEPKPPADKTEGGGRPPAGRGGNGSTKVQGFTDLPQEARDVCKSQEKQFVGKGKAFPDAAAWHKHYVEVYFAGN